VSVTLASQSAQLPDIKTVRPEYRAIHSQVLQDVLTRLDRAFQAFFRRAKDGEKPGYPRFKGSNQYNGFTYKQFGNGATLDNGFLVLSKIGRIALRWSRPLEGTPKTVTISREADGWYACFSCEGVPIRVLPATGQETGIDLGLASFATLADGTMIHTPPLLPQGRSRSAAVSAPGRSAQEREPPAPQGGRIARQSAPQSEAPAPGLPPQGGDPARSHQRHHLSRGLADGHHGQESPPRQEHR
jgi:hypothetical protein